MALKDSKDKLIHFICSEMPRQFNASDMAERTQQEQHHLPESLVKSESSLLSSYLQAFNFVELRLDNVLEMGSELPPDIYRCVNVRTLSLKNNFLRRISPEIGKMCKLERLFLTNNQLDNKSIPFTIAFCGSLSEVYLDNNLLDALPCILLRVRALDRVHRHGNHNYFKDTFMFYHTDINDRVLEIPGTKTNTLLSLQALAGNKVLTTRRNFYSDPTIPPRIKGQLTTLADTIELCDKCSDVLAHTHPRYRVFTFKNPYLGNTCVPFQHTACTAQCAHAIEVPARREQLNSARQQDWEYQQYIRESQLYLEDMERGSYFNSPGMIWTDTLRSKASRRSSTGSKSGLLSPVGPRSSSTTVTPLGVTGTRSGRVGSGGVGATSGGGTVSGGSCRTMSRSALATGGGSSSGSQTGLALLAATSRSNSSGSLRPAVNTCGIF